jgi:dihydrofolate synthase/folylpolyglutamate synthase
MLKYKSKDQSQRLKIKDYREAVEFLESLGNASEVHDRKKRLENLKIFLSFLGNPQNDFRAVHIVGTSGKGSVAVMLHGILSADGKSCGLYTSPHTTTFCERIKAGDRYIGEKDFVELTNFLKEKIGQFLPLVSHCLSLNFFESSFVIALLYFKKLNCEYIVVEAGMGGRLDSTNVFKNLVAAVITNIGHDHLEKIGPALRDVAYEKAGIIKRGALVLTGERNKQQLGIIAKEASKITNYKLQVTNYRELKNIKMGLNNIKFEYKKEYYKLKLLGAHQAKNAALAIECAKGLGISPAAIKKGLTGAFYPARLEVISKRPLIILDGAHNEDKLAAAMDFLKKSVSHKQNSVKYLILAAARNKEIKKAVPWFAKNFDRIYLTRFSNPFRKCFGFADWIKMFSPAARKKLAWRHRPQDALLDILKQLHNNDVVMVTGSIFLAGELREYWHPEEKIVKTGKSK